MDLGLAGMTAVVTGGSSGIGFETARLFLEDGAKVAICGRDRTRLDAALDKLGQLASENRLAGATADVLDPDSMSAFANQVKDGFGGVDILVNNAGQGRQSTFEDTSDEAWLEEMRLKYFGIIHPVRAFLPMLRASQHGAIVNINSLLALQPEPHMVATSATRAGALNLSRSLASEFGPAGIRVNSVLLGIVDSGQWRRRFERERGGEDYAGWLKRLAREKGIPMGRFAEPVEAARAIVYLASPAASYTTGATLDLSGGNARHIG